MTQYNRALINFLFKSSVNVNKAHGQLAEIKKQVITRSNTKEECLKSLYDTEKSLHTIQKEALDMSIELYQEQEELNSAFDDCKRLETKALEKYTTYKTDLRKQKILHSNYLSLCLAVAFSFIILFPFIRDQFYIHVFSFTAFLFLGWKVRIAHNRGKKK